MAFEIIKGFLAVMTTVKGLTGRAAKFTDPVSMPGFAVRALNSLCSGK